MSQDISPDKCIILPIQGRSMYPLLRIGDSAIIRKVRRVQIGDILVFRRKDGKQLGHRLIWIDPWGKLFELADNNGAEVVRWHPHEVEGKVIGIIRDGEIFPIPLWKNNVKSMLALSSYFVQKTAFQLRRMFPGYVKSSSPRSRYS